MNITVSIDFDKSKFADFEDIMGWARDTAFEFGRSLVKEILVQTDDALMAERDVARYRCKGFQKTCLKTTLGAVEYKRRVYVDNAAVEGLHCVHLLDDALNINKVGLVTSDVCRIVSTAVCESSYREATRMIQEIADLDLSVQGTWNIAQKVAASQSAVVDRHAELAECGQGAGVIASKILYEENDGIWLNLQGQSRRECGPSKEMKVGIAYDGATWSGGKNGKLRRKLDNKVAYASFETAKEFRRKKEGILASRFDVDEIELRVLNGDGANWIQQTTGENTIAVLDKFHRNKKITECVRDPEFAQLLRSHLYAGNIDTLLACIDAQINSLEDAKEIAALKTLQSYYTENKNALLGYYDRGISIPETREPGVVHHARLGSMESNVFTLIGNRMKGRRACWSIQGANNLALLLCQYHTTGFEYLFAKLPKAPDADEKPVSLEALPVYGAGKIPQREGHGYEYPVNCTFTNSGKFVQNLMKQINQHN